MSLYVPNEGEKEMMRSILAAQQWILGLYKNIVSPDGSLTMLGITEMPAGGGRGYAPKVLSMDFAEAPAADKWCIGLNSAGKAEGQYHNTYLEWEFLAADVADGNTVYGVMAYTYVLPFDAGLAAGPIKVGDTVTGLASGAAGVVTGVVVTSGSWVGNNAAGYLFIKNKTGIFQNDEALQVSGVTLATSNTGTLFGGDAHKKLVFLEEFPEAKAIDTAGQKIRVTMKWTLSTG
jgi:hypothetical protein